jgi:acyl-CoA dehydrogenase
MNNRIFKEEHDIFREAFRRFLNKEVKPYFEEWEEERIIPRDVWKKMGNNGYLCTWMEEEYGGAGVGFEYSMITIEEIMYSGALSFWTFLHSDIIVPYVHSFGSAEQKAKWLPGCASGDIITALAITEPGTGSDVASIRTTAVRDGNEYVINGQKTFISNGIHSDLVIVAAKTDTKVGSHKGVSLICVEKETTGFSRGRKLKKMGMHGQDTAELSFEDCRVPVSHLLGEEGKGFYYIMQKFQPERLIAALMAQAAAEAMLDMTIKYCKERHVFGKPISSFQHNSFKLVEMATEIELGRTFINDLIADFAAGVDITKKATMAKAWIPEMANRVAYQCVQLHGGYGYMEEYPICRMTRDVRPMAIFAGTTEVMKIIVGRMMGLS